VVNLDDAFGCELAQRWKHRRSALLGYGFDRRSGRLRTPCDEGRNLRVGLDGISFDIASPWGRATLESPLIGRFNAANLLGSLATLLASDVGLEQSVAALQKVVPVPGRTERYGGGRSPLVIVDYAHTPDALQKVLESLRAAAGGKARLICVFGCGGDRDRGKRPLMAAAAARHSDACVLTSDNPRSEDPLAILREMEAGIGGKNHLSIADRAEAISFAVQNSLSGDIILVAGKGHETSQQFSDHAVEFDDRKHAAKALRDRAQAISANR
jgi:UDP-N-acetylmuramoyl-L-alanyl-D-glutamate--2,6-diaminopimelate ligase